LEGKWERHQFMGTELCGKTLGIIGLGRVGQAVAERALAFKMRVLGYDPFLPEHQARELGIRTCRTLEDLFPEVDYLTVHTPLNEQTRNLIDRPQIQMMKKGVRIINCARGGIINEEALLEGLESGHIGGVALDVFTKEPCTNSPLFGKPNVLCTPHLGASTEEAQTNVAIEACELLVDFFTTGAVRNSVNMAPLDPKTLEGLRGYLDLVYRLGLLMAQVDREPPTRCKIRYQGEVANRDTRLLSAAFAAGLLQHALEQSVNLVNAPVLLQQRGIELAEERTTDIGDFASQVTVEVFRNDRSALAAGALFGKSLPRLVQKGEFRLESPLEGTMLIMYHRDVPGVIGRVGEIFGRHNVNIAFLSLGRAENKPGGDAIGVLALDSYPPAESIAEILKLEPIHRATVVVLPPRGELPPWLGIGMPK
jgi:D-3-phosphoglycerate dehydrogenase